MLIGGKSELYVYCIFFYIYIQLFVFRFCCINYINLKVYVLFNNKNYILKYIGCFGIILGFFFYVFLYFFEKIKIYCNNEISF